VAYVSGMAARSAHVHLGVVDPERLNLDHRVTGLGSGSGISRISNTSGPPNPVLRIARIGIPAGMCARNLHNQTDVTSPKRVRG
jgi:hypothetical protein